MVDLQADLGSPRLDGVAKYLKGIFGYFGTEPISKGYFGYWAFWPFYTSHLTLGTFRSGILRWETRSQGQSKAKTHFHKWLVQKIRISLL